MEGRVSQNFDIFLSFDLMNVEIRNIEIGKK